MWFRLVYCEKVYEGVIQMSFDHITDVKNGILSSMSFDKKLNGYEIHASIDLLKKGSAGSDLASGFENFSQVKKTDTILHRMLELPKALAVMKFRMVRDDVIRDERRKLQKEKENLFLKSFHLAFKDTFHKEVTPSLSPKDESTFREAIDTIATAVESRISPLVARRRSSRGSDQIEDAPPQDDVELPQTTEVVISVLDDAIEADKKYQENPGWTTAVALIFSLADVIKTNYLRKHWGDNEVVKDFSIREDFKYPTEEELSKLSYVARDVWNSLSRLSAAEIVHRECLFPFAPVEGTVWNCPSIGSPGVEHYETDGWKYSSQNDFEKLLSCAYMVWEDLQNQEAAEFLARVIDVIRLQPEHKKKFLMREDFRETLPQEIRNFFSSPIDQHLHGLEYVERVSSTLMRMKLVPTNTETIV